ncbi:MAG TPA: hypothetical protein VFS67_35495 [Polyangiaceae bacterium]|nr:hypothetical protein [Polyangiaceae bacterium]
MTRRKEREAAYRSPNAGIGNLSFDAIVSAKQSLRRALHDRLSKVARLPTNHYSPNAFGAIVLAEIALNVSINEAIAMGSTFGGNVDRELATQTLCVRFDRVASSSPGFETAATELRLMVDMRDELAHYLPRAERSAAGNVPEWCRTLQQRGFFIEAPGYDYQFCQKISSYALAYWAYGVASETIRLFVGRLPEAARNVCDYIVENFVLYPDICPPEALGEFDEANGLELTQFEQPQGSA